MSASQISPRLDRILIQLDDSNQYYEFDDITFKVPSGRYIKRVSLYFDPRLYYQYVRVSVDGKVGDCEISYSQNSCHVDIEVLKDSKPAGSVMLYVYASTSGGSYMELHRARVLHDNTPIMVRSYSKVDDRLKLHIYDPDADKNYDTPGATTVYGAWGLDRVLLNHHNYTTDTSYADTLDGATIEAIDEWNKYVYFDLSGMEDGFYESWVTVYDTFGNVSGAPSTTFGIDNTPPKIGFELFEGDFSEPIADIRDIKITLQDKSKAYVTEASITAANNDKTWLSTIDHGNFTTVGLTILAPAESYNLHVTAQDVHGNVSSNTVKFSLKQRENTIEVSQRAFLTVDEVLLDTLDQPFFKISSDDILVTEYGTTARGVQKATLTSNASAGFPIKVVGMGAEYIVNPGEVKSIDLDLGQLGSKLELFAYPAETGKSGNATIQLDIPKLTSSFD